MGEEKIKEAKNIQRYSFQITINNPLEKGWDHPVIKETLIVNFSTLKYFCMADEIGGKGTYHTHIYAVFSSRVRWSKVKKAFGEAHIEAAHGSAEDNLGYIKKEGKWKLTDKAETSVEGTFEEWGNFPEQKGRNTDMQELYEMVKNGYSNAEILELNNDYILQIDKLDKLRTMLLTEKYKGSRRLDLKVAYIYGATGTGKTSGILDRHGDENVYRITDYDHPFDSYSCQPVIAFDEYRSQLRISDMLQYCDVYPVELCARYSNKYACFHTVYIVSNWTLEQQYQKVQEESPESWQAFLRRIHEIIVYHKNRAPTKYDSVEKYLNRSEEFHELPDAEQSGMPFS